MHSLFYEMQKVNVRCQVSYSLSNLIMIMMIFVAAQPPSELNIVQHILLRNQRECCQSCLTDYNLESCSSAIKHLFFIVVHSV